MARVLLFKDYHRASLHISSCVVLERGGSNVCCSIDEGRPVVTHGGQLVLRRSVSNLSHTVVLSVRSFSMIHFSTVFQQTARFFAGGPCLVQFNIVTHSHRVWTMLPINTNSACTQLNFDRKLSGCRTLIRALLCLFFFLFSSHISCTHNGKRIHHYR